MKRYRYKAYRISWGGPEGSWDRFVSWGSSNLKHFWAGMGVVTFSATPEDMQSCIKAFNVDADSFVVKVGPRFEPYEEYTD